MTDARRIFTPAIWGFYLLVVFEILYMISPFALYFYSTYGPTLNFWHGSAATAWLTNFFLPHFSHTTSPILNALPTVGFVFVVIGALLFATGFVQIYGAKLFRRAEVTGGLYRVVRHPQYVALAIVGLGTTLIWPRFLVLLAYVTMLFLYVFLARWEEEECTRKFGDAYRDYAARTGMFVPGPLALRVPRILPAAGGARIAAALAWYAAVLGGTALFGFALRGYALSTVSGYYTDDAAVLSPAVLSDAELQGAYRVATADPEVQAYLAAAEPSAKLLAYVIPVDWSLADLPVEREHRPGGHYQPADFDRARYKVLVTAARTHAPQSRGREIVTRAYGRDPLVLAKVDLEARRVTSVETPPPHVVWGDIPTPMF